MRVLTLLSCLLLLARSGGAQTCNTHGQTPETAFPVCGTSVFTQTTVPLCGGRTLPSPACSRDQLTDVNPFYYKFTCFEAGTLGFVITPKNNSSDYDWEVYDITGRKPGDIFNDGSLVVSSNWSGETGTTGASAQGNQIFVCAGTGKPLWSSMPQLVKGHEYLLLVSHFTNSQSGYDLEFKGGTAVITDPKAPGLQNATAHCNAQTIRLKLNKMMRCNSITASGSEFVILPNNTPVSSASPICGNGFETDSVEIRLARPLDPGNYQLAIRAGTDANTILDNCGNGVPEGELAPFKVDPTLPTRLDSIVPVGCAPNQLTLVFRKGVYCNTVAADGSDFVIQGPYAVGITRAVLNCQNGLSETITLELAAPMVDAGNFRVALRRNASGTVPTDECGNPIPLGAVNFTVADTVSAAFTYNIQYGCTTDSVQFNHPGTRGVNQWSWILDEGKTSTVRNPLALYNVFTTKNIRLAVSNGVCVDTADTKVVLENFLSLDFKATTEECPNEPVQFTSTAVGRGLRHRWVFGDGTTSSEAQPVHRFNAPLRTAAINVTYSVTDSFGCTRSVTKPITIYSSCTVHVPNAFTPGSDGRNDLFRPLNAFRIDGYEFIVYNRWGQEVFRTRDPKRGWDGRISGQLQNTGTYVWTLRYRELSTGTQMERKGSVVLIR
ncbi:gliding motility-associated C-terminal domain-containing protein [Cnuella takakiae]|uniref:Gliding motility-associated C-terminal domain-containing protein n=1 Tax=Cnuella takakiae TaxID=1302690 RepID=A0A1M4WL87_9BACT|nr:gliding motility-associated C-terminal domain-containing protein [Cnuella takakiae]SHE81986.1 gliding motility-associated C-terminal domain-containing protein [Cnuella takakiae]